MTADVELWRPGWDVEPCETADPHDPDRRGHGNPYANVTDEPDAYRTTVTVGSIDDYEPGDQP
ncbi:hypothetical protein ACFXD5_19595 [Streptomyces sp. NPDC059385]|uniref:hypothetical protein n=1 Tax=Streptomyces sp. NPDC059385 TaxID=3346817 RepID=UPI003688CD2D